MWGVQIMTQEDREEQLWFKSIQNKLKRRIANPRWDSLSLTTTEWDIIMFIAKAKSVNDLPLLINERITDNLLNKIDNQFKQMKGKEF